MKDLKQLVLAEAKRIKKYATKEEISKLDFYNLNAGSEKSCIYGQMTGDCFSERSFELLKLSAIKPYSDGVSYFQERVIPFKDQDRDTRCFSPIEHYIYQQNANNEGLIAFIKGEIKLKDLML